MGLMLREVLTYGPGEHTFQPDDYPWLAAVRVAGQSGAGGASSDGNPGEPGQFKYFEIPADKLPTSARIVVGAGGSGGSVVDQVTGEVHTGQRGEDGFIALELYEELPDEDGLGQ